MAGVKITFNKAAIKAKIEKAAEAVKAPVMEQVLKDSNYFCREDTGNLIASSEIASRPKDGIVVWDTPYAKHVYYTGKPSTNVNPNASLTWFEKAKGVYGKDWAKIAQTVFNVTYSSQPSLVKGTNDTGKSWLSQAKAKYKEYTEKMDEWTDNDNKHD